MQKKLFCLVAFLSLLIPAERLWAASDIIFMHGFKSGDFLEKKLNELVDTYNQRPHTKHPVRLVSGGDYTTSFTHLREGKIKPHIAMVSEYNSTAMYDHPHLYVPLEDVISVKQISFLPVIRTFYSFKGRMMSYPFNCSAPALFYNKEAFRKAGLPDRAPQTWEEIEKASEKLKAAGYGGFTFAWPAAYALEHFSVVHNVPMATYHNGFKNPKKARLTLDKQPFLNQLKFLQDQVQKGHFLYAGRKAEDAEKLFLEGKVGILMQGANRASLLQGKNPQLQMGVGPYPYRRAFIRKPYGVNICGTSLWVMKGHDQDRAAVADFLKYLSSPEIQAKWHQDTAYLPVTREAYDLTQKSGFYTTHPAALVGVQQVLRKPQNLPHGIRLPNYGETREKMTDTLDRIFKNQADVKREMVDLIKAQR